MDAYLPPPEPLSPLRSSFAFSGDLPSPTSETLEPSSTPSTSNTTFTLSTSAGNVSPGYSVLSSATSDYTSPASASSFPLSPVSSWTNQQLRDWLECLHCGAYYRTFEDNHITGDILLECDDSSLRDMGIRKVGDRIRIQQSLNKLRKQAAKTHFIEIQHNNLEVPGNNNNNKGSASSKHSSFTSTLTPSNQHLFVSNNTLNGQQHISGYSNSPNSKGNSPIDGFFTPTGPPPVSSSNLQNPNRLPEILPGLPSKPRSGNSTAQTQTNSSRNHYHSAPSSATIDPRSQSSNHQTDQVKKILSMDDVKQSTVRFINTKGQCKTSNISGYFSGPSIKRKALKKFSIKENPDNWVVFIADNELGTTTRRVNDLEIVTICHSQDRLERYRLMLCPVGTTPTIEQLSKSQQILRDSITKAAVAAAAALPDLSNPSYQPQPHSANSVQSFDEKELSSSHNNNSKHNIQYNSHDYTNYNMNTSNSEKYTNLTPTSDITSQNTKGTAPLILSSAKRMRKFYGQRPPSELISSNLQEYFPEAGPKVLEETIRNSIMFKRMSRMSRLSQRSSIASGWGIPDSEADAPPIPSLDEIWDEAQGDKPTLSLKPSGLPTSSSSSLATGSTSSLPSSPINMTPSLPNPSTRNKKPLYLQQNSSFGSISNNKSGSAGSKGSESASTSNLPSFDEKTLPPVPQQFSSDRRSSSFSTPHTDNTDNNNNNGTLTPKQLQDGSQSNTGDNIEEEYMELLQQEQSGPSKWIKGTLIGSGSFGTVYLGMNSITGELMAVKQVELLSDKSDEHEQRKKSMIDALQREMKLLQDLQHPNIVQYLGSNCENNYLNIYLEYVPGGSVATMLSNYGAFEESLIRNFVKQILHGLKYLHDRSIIHRDIKGANVLVDNKGTIKISDFGISKKLEDKNARTSLQGSVYWMAPEVVKQKPYTFKADIWSLGCLIVEMFTGSRPFPEFQHLQALFNIGKETPVPPTIPEQATPEAQNFLKQAFEIDYNKRPTAQEMLQHQFLKTLI